MRTGKTMLLGTGILRYHVGTVRGTEAIPGPHRQEPEWVGTVSSD